MAGWEGWGGGAGITALVLGVAKVIDDRRKTKGDETTAVTARYEGIIKTFEGLASRAEKLGEAMQIKADAAAADRAKSDLALVEERALRVRLEDKLADRDAEITRLRGMLGDHERPS